MLKKIIPLFIFINFLFILPVHADKEYKFTLNKELENKQIIYEWDNHIDNFSFQMVSPSNQVYALGSYELLDYDEENNRIEISFSNLQSGQWKVFFKGDTNPVSLSNQIVDYYPEINTSSLETEIIDENIDEQKQDIIVIGAENDKIEEENEESSEIEESFIEENKSEEISEEEIQLLKEKEELALEREKERTEALQSKKEEKENEEQIKREQELEAQREESEIVLEFEETTETKQTEDSNEEQVIILGTDENASPTIVNVEKSESDINVVNINADEERAKIESKIQEENNRIMINNAIMVTPLIISIFLFIINLIIKKVPKKK